MVRKVQLTFDMLIKVVEQLDKNDVRSAPRLEMCSKQMKAAMPYFWKKAQLRIILGGYYSCKEFKLLINKRVAPIELSLLSALTSKGIRSCSINFSYLKNNCSYAEQHFISNLSANIPPVKHLKVLWPRLWTKPWLKVITRLLIDHSQTIESVRIGQDVVINDIYFYEIICALSQVANLKKLWLKMDSSSYLIDCFRDVRARQIVYTCNSILSMAGFADFRKTLVDCSVRLVLLNTEMVLQLLNKNSTPYPNIRVLHLYGDYEKWDRKDMTALFAIFPKMKLLHYVIINGTFATRWSTLTGPFSERYSMAFDLLTASKAEFPGKVIVCMRRMQMSRINDDVPMPPATDEVQTLAQEQWPLAVVHQETRKSPIIFDIADGRRLIIKQNKPTSVRQCTICPKICF